MEMEMVNRLATIAPAIYDDPIAAGKFLLLGHLADYVPKMGK